MSQNILQDSFNTQSDENSMIKPEKKSVGKKISKVFTKMLWHLNQGVPTYMPSNNHQRNAKESTKQSIENIVQRRKSTGNINAAQKVLVQRQRSRSICRRPSTLMSIQEENENEFVNAA